MKRLTPTTPSLSLLFCRLPGLYCGKVARNAWRKCQVASAAIADVLAENCGLCEEKVPLRKVYGGCVRGKVTGGEENWLFSRFSDPVVGVS